MLLSIVRFMFPYRIFYRGVPGFATDCLCGVGCSGLTTCLLYDVGPLFGRYAHVREQTCQMRMQCQWSPAVVMNASSFPVHIHLCLTRVEIIR